MRSFCRKHGKKVKQEALEMGIPAEKVAQISEDSKICLQLAKTAIKLAGKIKPKAA